MRIEEQGGGVLVIILFWVVTFPFGGRKGKKPTFGIACFGGGEGEEKPEGGKLLLCVCFTRAGLLENKRLGAFIVPYSEHVTGASIFVRDCIVL